MHNPFEPPRSNYEREHERSELVPRNQILPSILAIAGMVAVMVYAYTRPVERPSTSTSKPRVTTTSTSDRQDWCEFFPTK